ncbi:MAG: sigma-70 family RNA polymerase sigma factor [Alphaproteobacteria bacterium]|nr:sigma-70 family RNA polymerase sigma factor [Alphaproteobacteria bacterium]MBU0795896.1 sigma-70 family RNA polymerase sigma factor [Alphaproteobacteria bacterium]MBU0887215.1 sigma-70 family RNA polymerase sigma factor [Alphaproteobacteria bacterium]MBU1812257.1 sigma-70 family RNA polymerase sigma factor [Alphaproteobacteria bacterium]MBU2090595.1 sigma-70 family RNA polymerase sigma factor [Alphaproteobacteria bacterium]
MPTSFKEELVEIIPHLRAFARMLSGNDDKAKDLVQDTIVRALAAEDKYSPGTNFKAWMFTILRNIFYDSLRQKKFEMEPIDDAALMASVPASQEIHLEVRDFKRAFVKLAPEQREVLILVGASGFSYEEAAVVCKCAVGTIKSRVSRARSELAVALGHGKHAEADIIRAAA